MYKLKDDRFHIFCDDYTKGLREFYQRYDSIAEGLINNSFNMFEQQLDDHDIGYLYDGIEKIDINPIRIREETFSQFKEGIIAEVIEDVFVNMEKKLLEEELNIKIMNDNFGPLYDTWLEMGTHELENLIHFLEIDVTLDPEKEKKWEALAKEERWEELAKEKSVDWWEAPNNNNREKYMNGSPERNNISVRDLNFLDQLYHAFQEELKLHPEKVNDIIKVIINEFGKLKKEN